jgi:hypothetical protein
MISRLLIFAAFALAIAPIGCGGRVESSIDGDASPIGQAVAEHKSGVQVAGDGLVNRILSDDKQGSRHQRIIVRLDSGQTILIEHNIDLAPRLEGIKEGDKVTLFGEYIWNDQGGLVHWTHKDPARKHIDGWIKHDGKIYQ